MKTNPAARRFVRVRGIVMCLVIVGMVGIAFELGDSLAKQLGPNPAPQTEGQPVPKVNLGEVMVAMR